MCLVMVCCVACSSLVVSTVTVVKLEGEQGHVQICSAAASPPSCSEGLLVLFCLRERPQTAELDKPRHFAVTSLGLTSGLGWSVGQI